MLAFRTLLSSTFIVYVFARPDGVIDDERGGHKTQFATSLTGGEGCSTSDLIEIRDGFADMTLLYQAAVPFDTKHQPAIEFFGPPPQIANYTEMIAGNFQRGANYAAVKGKDGVVANTDIHVRCDDPMSVCKVGNKRDGTHAAYNIGNDPHVNFCDDYFKMDGLVKKVDKKAGNQMARDRLMDYYNRGTLWARLVMHFSDVGKAKVVRAIPGGPNVTTEWTLSVTEGAMNTSVLAGVLNERPDNDGPGPNFSQTLKFAYGVTRAKLLAMLSTQMPYDAANNAENYALYAQARYIMVNKGFYPNVPIIDFPNEATVLTNENLQDGERTKYACFDITDVVARPANMERKGGPLPFSSSPKNSLPSWKIILTALAMVYCSMLSLFG